PCRRSMKSKRHWRPAPCRSAWSVLAARYLRLSLHDHHCGRCRKGLADDEDQVRALAAVTSRQTRRKFSPQIFPTSDGEEPRRSSAAVTLTLCPTSAQPTTPPP